jgi:hypothetical protein
MRRSSPVVLVSVSDRWQAADLGESRVAPTMLVSALAVAPVVMMVVGVVFGSLTGR